MKSAVIVFPGSNCDRDAKDALTRISGIEPVMVWHKEAALPPGLDLVMVPGGFSFGDYLRSGAMAGNSPIIEALRTHATRGGYVLGVCNGFQILTETGLLPGALLRNARQTFVCRPQQLVTVNRTSAFTRGYATKSDPTIPVAHHDGCYFADETTLDRLEAEDRVAFRYASGTNPNGSQRDIAGVLSKNGRVLGMMPHPERAVDDGECGSDGAALFDGLLEAHSIA